MTYLRGQRSYKFFTVDTHSFSQMFTISLESITYFMELLLALQRGRLTFRLRTGSVNNYENPRGENVKQFEEIESS